MGGNMDVNKWLRQDIELPVGEDYRIIIEATVGWPSESDIAIDDVSFTPDCIIEQTSTSSTHSTASSTQSTPTSTRSTPTSSKSTHTSSSPMSPTTQLATSAPSNPHKHTATIVGVVVGVLSDCNCCCCNYYTVQKEH